MYETGRQNLSNPIELAPTSPEAIELWYRNLRPDRDINEVPLETHLDGIASTVLYAINEPLPDNSSTRIRRALEYTTSGANRLVAPIASEGAKNFVLLDLITELPEREDTPTPGAMLTLLEFGARTALAMRENPALPLEDRLKANSRLANLHIAYLNYGNKLYPEKSRGYSDKYISAVREEAQWVNRAIPQTRGISGGALFETFVGILSKYQAWNMEVDDSTIVRHATLREDMPSESYEGGSGHELAHDTVIEGKAGKVRLQSKWGPNTKKKAVNYDLSKITMVSETGSDGVLERYADFKGNFESIAKSADPKHADRCDVFVERYNLNRAIRRASEPVAKNIGERALVSATS